MSPHHCASYDILQFWQGVRACLIYSPSRDAERSTLVTVAQSQHFDRGVAPLILRSVEVLRPELPLLSFLPHPWARFGPLQHLAVQPLAGPPLSNDPSCLSTFSGSSASQDLDNHECRAVCFRKKKHRHFFGHAKHVADGVRHDLFTRFAESSAACGESRSLASASAMPGRRGAASPGEALASSIGTSSPVKL